MEQQPPKIAILKYVVDNQPAPATAIKRDLGISVGSLYHHLKILQDSGFIAQVDKRRYVATEDGKKVVKNLKDHMLIVDWKRPAEPIASMADRSLRISIPSPIMGKRHESYDNIAKILVRGKKGFRISQLTRTIGHGRLTAILSVLAKRRLLMNDGGVWKTTERGLIYLYLYSSLVKMLK